LDCKRRVTIQQTYEEYGRTAPECPHCQSKNLERLLSRVRFMRSEESRLDSLADPSSWGDLDENDPRSMARMMRKMGQEMGEDMPPEFDEVVDRMEAGEDPEQIEKSIGGDDFGGDF
jgi:hypothetical protein